MVLQITRNMKRTLFRFVSHEVRTPLNIIALAGELMEERFLRGSHGQDSLHIVSDIREACQDMLTILDDMLAYDKIEDGILQLELELEPINLVTYIENIVNSFQDKVCKYASDVYFILIVFGEIGSPSWCNGVASFARR